MEYANILVVEDEGIVAKDLSQRLQSMGHTVVAMVASGKEAVKKATELQSDLILMDIRLRGEMDGVDTASEIHARYDVPVIYLTAHADTATLRRAKVTEPFGYFLKPFEERELQVTIELTLHKHQMERQLRDYVSGVTTSLTLLTRKSVRTSLTGEAEMRLYSPIREDAWTNEQNTGCAGKRCGG